MSLFLSDNINKIALHDGKVRAESWYLTNTKQINLFIGPNNSGKSRVVRKLFNSENKDWLIETNILSLVDIIEEIKQKISKQNNYFGSIGIPSVTGNIILANLKTIDSVPVPLDEIAEYLTLSSNSQVRPNQTKIIKERLIQPILDNLSNDKKSEKTFLVPERSLYIPTLRSLRSVAEDDIFKQRTLGDYFDRGLKDNKLIFTGHSLYDDLVQHLLGTHKQREKVREYEKYLSVNFFFGQDISLVPMVNKDVVYFKEGDKEERPIYDLGDGIQSIIIITFPLFMADKPSMFFIEEPEHYLHAGLQRTLIETIATNKNHLFFITTHSNHFLDLAQERTDISIQQVSKYEDKTVVKPALEYGRLLDDLGVRASSVLLANCSIWVEGVTDKLYLRTYMKKYISELEDSGNLTESAKLKSYHENLHYVFTEYQGSNITHWDFDENAEDSDTNTPAKKLNRNILLIADADINGKGDRVESLTLALGDCFYLLDWKEIENYIPHDLLIKTANKRWLTFTQREGCDNNRIKGIEKGKFESNSDGIGRILERYVDKSSTTTRDFYKEKSGTIKDKVKFCHTAIAEMNNENNTWSLTPELTSLCKKLWKHVDENN